MYTYEVQVQCNESGLWYIQAERFEYYENPQAWFPKFKTREVCRKEIKKLAEQVKSNKPESNVRIVEFWQQNTRIEQQKVIWMNGSWLEMAHSV